MSVHPSSNGFSIRVGLEVTRDSIGSGFDLANIRVHEGVGVRSMPSNASCEGSSNASLIPILCNLTILRSNDRLTIVIEERQSMSNPIIQRASVLPNKIVGVQLCGFEEVLAYRFPSLFGHYLST